MSLYCRGLLVVLMVLINLIFSCGALSVGMATSGAGNHRQARAKETPDWGLPVVWANSESEQNIIARPQNQRSQEQDMFTPENHPHTPSPVQPWMEDSKNNVEMTQSPSNQNGDRHLPVGTVLLLLLFFVGALFVALVIKRRQELARWREYRTHQILQAQDEAFDMNYDEAFDLELVEGSSQVTNS